MLDSGCGRTIIGLSTLRSFEAMWRQLGWQVPAWNEETHQFKFGNGEIETSTHTVYAGHPGSETWSDQSINHPGGRSLLLSRAALKTLGASIDFEKDRLQVFNRVVPLKTNSAGQYIVNLMGSPSEELSTAASFTEIMASTEQSRLKCLSMNHQLSHCPSR